MNELAWVCCRVVNACLPFLVIPTQLLALPGLPCTYVFDYTPVAARIALTEAEDATKRKVGASSAVHICSTALSSETKLICRGFSGAISAVACATAACASAKATKSGMQETPSRRSEASSMQAYIGRIVSTASTLAAFMSAVLGMSMPAPCKCATKALPRPAGVISTSSPSSGFASRKALSSFSASTTSAKKGVAAWPPAYHFGEMP